ncbi:MAG TPA: gluconate 2-dehydrogenase subunit 3 family protein [Bryobacteraceae bacterium]|jgi:gluconate 2-dehydrogenase gamma chain
MEYSRRGLMLGLGLTTLSGIAAAQQHAHDALQSGSPKFQYLDATTAAELEALTSQILPSDDGPGAREAGAVYFIDHVLATFESGKRDAYRNGMHEVQQARARLFPHSSTIAGLQSAEQIQLLHAIEKSPFFELLRTHTVWGFVGSPSYLGNRGKVGWTHIGFDDRMHFEPPFGYYDAAARGHEKS